MPRAKIPTAIKRTAIKQTAIKQNQNTSLCNKYKTYLTTFKSVKTSLKHIIKNPVYLGQINTMVFTMNRIVIHSYNFLKLYILNYFSIHNIIPRIDKNFIVLIMKTVSVKGDKRGSKASINNQTIIDDLQAFHTEHYKPLMKEKEVLSYTGLIQMLEYEAEQILTCFENHIQEHFEDMVNRFVNIIFYQDSKIREGSEQDQKRLFRSELAKIKKSIMNSSGKIENDDPTYEIIVDLVNNQLLKGVAINKSLAYMTQSDSLALLPIAIRMSKCGEIIMRGRYESLFKIMDYKNLLQISMKGTKAINVFPLRKSVIPKYIDIDTFLIASNLIGKGNTEYFYNNNLVLKAKEIWGKIFKTNISVFRKKGYKFSRMISTDGIGCTILFIRSDLYKETKKSMVHSIKKPKGYKEDIYVDDLTQEQKIEILKKKKVGIDPGKNTLITCVDGKIETIEKDNGKEYRKVNNMVFTNKQNRSILKCSKNGKKIEKDKKTSIMEEKSVKERETSLSEYNSATCNLDRFKEYLKVKNEENEYLIEYYQKDMYRKLKLETYGNQQKMKEELIKKFANKFGSKDEVVILMGNWSETKQMKNLDPSKGKGIRRIFKRYGYELYLVDEYKTSCRLYETGEELLNVRGKHELLGSKIYNKVDMDKDNLNKEVEIFIAESGRRPTIINRDINGALNIRLKGIKILEGGEVPEYMQRNNNED